MVLPLKIFGIYCIFQTTQCGWALLSLPHHELHWEEWHTVNFYLILDSHSFYQQFICAERCIYFKKILLTAPCKGWGKSKPVGCGTNYNKLDNLYYYLLFLLLIIIIFLSLLLFLLFSQVMFFFCVDRLHILTQSHIYCNSTSVTPYRCMVFVVTD